MSPRYIDHIPPDPTGLVDPGDLPVPLPHGLTPRDFFRMVEDVHDVLHDVNSVLHAKSYQRLEELLDPAGFSGMVSRTVVTRLARASRILVMNAYHNGYPDLLVDGQHPGNAAQHAEEGLEVKASRYESGWQTHGPRAGWFCVTQFEMDLRDEVALFDREPTRVRAVLVAELEIDDWSWAPAQEGKIRSGTASLRASGVAKCRAGAVWVDPEYRATHDELALKAKVQAFRAQSAQLISQAIGDSGGALTLDQLTVELRSISPFADDAALRKALKARLDAMVKKGLVLRDGGGYSLP